MDSLFPLEPLKKLGFKHIHLHGMKAYNGVAILSRLPFAKTEVRHWQGKQDCRHAVALLKNGVEIHTVYVPAGGDIADPKTNQKFAHKLGFVEEQTAWWEKQRRDRPRILLGDLNIAPLDHDVWSHKQMLTVVSHTPAEVARLNAWQQAHHWVDAVRHFVPATEKLYSWWSYRAADWEKSDRGRRLDHIWVTPDLRPQLKSTSILRPARGWDPPSDHVPVIVEIT